MRTELLQTTLHDDEVLQRVLAGEVALYEIIIRRYNPLLYKIGRSYGLMHEDVQDAMQETFIAAYEGLPRFRKESLLSTWLTRIMINKCLYKMKRMIRNQPLNTPAEREAAPGMTPDRLPLQYELKRILESCVEKLPEPYRLVFLLRETENFSVLQTAEALNITPLNVKVRLNRAKAMMRESLEHWYSKTDIYDFHLSYCSEVVKNVLERITLSS